MSRKAQEISPETFNRLLALVVPQLDAGGPVLVYVLHQWRRIGHLTIEPQILQSRYAAEYARIVIVTGRLDQSGSLPDIARCVDPRIVFVETEHEDVISIGTADGGLLDLRHFHLLLSSPRTLIVEFWRAVIAGLRPARLSLPHDLRARAGEALSTHGIDPDVPFVTFHLRTMKYLPGEAHHGHRTASMDAYEDAIRLILDRGYQVLRIGEPGLERWERSPDGYLSLADAFPDDRWIDLFACADCAFATAQNSGPVWVVAAFGNPSLRTNTPLEHLNLPYNDDLSLFKHYRWRDGGETLRYREILDAGLPSLLSDAAFAEKGVDLVENTPHEILAATEEVLAKVSGTWSPDTAMEERFRLLGEAYEARIKTDPEIVSETMDFYGYSHGFGRLCHGMSGWRGYFD